MADTEEISDFLFRFKFFAQNSNCFVFVEREKNMQFLAELGITSGQALTEIILQLTQHNYVEGPLQDLQFPNQNLWVFGSDYEGTEIYIKLNYNSGKKVAQCLSFHRPENPLSYPLRNELI